MSHRIGHEGFELITVLFAIESSVVDPNGYKYKERNLHGEEL